MDQGVINAMVGAACSGVFLLVITAGSGLVRSHIRMLKDIGVLEAQFKIFSTSMESQMTHLDARLTNTLRVAESRSAEAFLDPNPITEDEKLVFHKSWINGAITLTEDELQIGIQALDREWDMGHIPEHKKGDAKWLLAIFNSELRSRQLSKLEPAPATIEEVLEAQRPTNWWGVLWPFHSYYSS